MNMTHDGIGMTSARTRERLIQRLREEGIRDERVLAAIREVPRHIFIEEALAHRAYEDTPLPIGLGQTISQPYIVARMTEAILGSGRPNRVLEVGTGCGYQTAVLAKLVGEVCTIERIEPLLKAARKRLASLRALNVRFQLGDGSLGWPAYAPYDGILVAAAADKVPEALQEQLAPGGRLIIPVGEPGHQDLLLIQRTPQGLTTERIELVSFVPLVRSK